MKDYYGILGVSRHATYIEIKKAYRSGARKHHPDKNPGDVGASERFREVQEAYDTLIDSSKRAAYDRIAPKSQPKSKSEEPGPSPSSSDFFEEVKEEFFGGSNFKGRSITVRIEIELKEVFSGCNKNIKIKKRKRCTGCKGNGYTSFVSCNNCKGTGTIKSDSLDGIVVGVLCTVCSGTGKSAVVKCGDCAGSGYLPGWYEKPITIVIPPGIQNGMQLRIVGEGEESIRGGISGDVTVFVLVKENQIFARDGSDLSLEIPISYTQLVLGQEIEIPTISDGLTKIKIPPGSQSHTKFRLKGKGLPDGKGFRGDLIALLKIETPKTLSEEYEKIIKELSELEKNNLTPRREQWFKKINLYNK
jgi:molecular chaperone DnaJ